MLDGSKNYEDTGFENRSISTLCENGVRSVNNEMTVVGVKRDTCQVRQHVFLSKHSLFCMYALNTTEVTAKYGKKGVLLCTQIYKSDQE